MPDLTTTHGRVSRATFWIFHVCLGALLVLYGLIAKKDPLPVWVGVFGIMLKLLLIPIMLMGIIVQIKRWHDRDKSGWWALISLVPVLGIVWTLIECGLLKGTEGPNRFGPAPERNVQNP